MENKVEMNTRRMMEGSFWVPMVLMLSMMLMALASCGPKSTGIAEMDEEEHAQVVQDWVEYRIGRLTEPTGWLRLAGMMPIAPGENRFGSGEDMDVRFPEGTMPEFAGVMTLEGDRVTVRVREGVDFRVEFPGDVGADGVAEAGMEGEADDADPSAKPRGVTMRDVVAYEGVAEGVSDNPSDALDSESQRASLAPTPPEPPRMFHGDLEFFVIKRGDLHMIRLYNYDNPAADRFDGFPRYPLDLKWRVEARFEPAEEGKTIRMVNILDQLSDEPVMGTYFFEVDGVEYSLDALEGSETRHFVIVGDQTNRTDSYQAGRYIYVDHPDENGRTVFDFNMMYNPPCSFNAFTTCLLAPPQNRLDVAITAGELRPQEEWRVVR